MVGLTVLLCRETTRRIFLVDFLGHGRVPDTLRFFRRHPTLDLTLLDVFDLTVLLGGKPMAFARHGRTLPCGAQHRTDTVHLTPTGRRLSLCHPEQVSVSMQEHHDHFALGAKGGSYEQPHPAQRHGSPCGVRRCDRRPRFCASAGPTGWGGRGGYESLPGDRGDD